MTRQRSFKRLVRSRMEKTGESYTAARAVLLEGKEQAVAEAPAPLITSDANILERTGRGWEAWFDLLDGWGAEEQPHREIARRVAAELGIEPLAWNAQAITVSYERARGLRVVGQRSDGIGVTVQRTVAVPVERLFDAWVGDEERSRWLEDGPLRERTATRPKSARFDWLGDGTGSRVHVVFVAKGEASSTMTVEHLRLADAGEVDRMRAFWRERLVDLKARLEG